MDGPPQILAPYLRVVTQPSSLNQLGEWLGPFFGTVNEQRVSVCIQIPFPFNSVPPQLYLMLDVLHRKVRTVRLQENRQPPLSHPQDWMRRYVCNPVVG